jgi:cyclophilin family peptidyl-prolyl cis-trans isomerase
MGMNKKIRVLAGWLLIGVLAGTAQAGPWVKVTTSMGDFTIELNPARAPLTVANFLQYVKEGHYSGTLFHRVVSNFVVQGGGYAADYQLKPVHEPVANEAGNGLRNTRGTVGLARAGEPHSGNAQFYVNVADNPDLDPVTTRWGYAVFGKVVQGQEVVDRMGVLPTGKAGPFKSEAPLSPVIIEKAELLSGPPADLAPSAAQPQPDNSIPSAPSADTPPHG